MCDGISNTDFEKEVGGLKKYIALKRPKEYLFMPLIIWTDMKNDSIENLYINIFHIYNFFKGFSHQHLDYNNRTTAYSL